MTIMAEINASQDGALLSRRRQQPTMKSVPINRNVLFELAGLHNFGIESKPDPVNFNGIEEPSPPSTVILDRKIRVCRVETLLKDRFTAVFSERGLVDQRVLFRLSLVAESDLQLLEEGAVFYWITAIERKPKGEVISTAYIRFRRRPRLLPKQVEELDRLADEIIRAGGATPIEG